MPSALDWARRSRGDAASYGSESSTRGRRVRPAGREGDRDYGGEQEPYAGAPQSRSHVMTIGPTGAAWTPLAVTSRKIGWPGPTT